MREEHPQEKIPAGMATAGNPLSFQMAGFGNPAILSGDHLVHLRPGDGCNDPHVRARQVPGDEHEFSCGCEIEPVVQKIVCGRHSRRILDHVDIQTLILKQAPGRGDVEKRRGYDLPRPG